MPKKFKKFLVYVLILTIPLLFLFSRQAIYTPLKAAFVDFALGPLEIISIPFRELKKILVYHQTYEKYMSLKKEVDSLRSRLTGQEEVFRENNRYKKLLGFKTDLVFSTVVANVVGRDPSNWNAAIIIDKGEVNGLQQGMPVMSPLGVIGKVSEVSKRTSKVILLIDPNFSVAAVIERSREGGLISGTLQGMCRMRYLSPSANIEIGDKVVTSKLSSSFPEGLLIGEVTAIEESQTAPSVECLVEPAIDLSELEEVIVIQK